MTISALAPSLQPMVEQISQQLRFICFFILTAALIVRTGTGSKNIAPLMRPIVTNIFLCGIIATLPFWFNLVRDAFWNVAVTIRSEFTGSVTGTGTALMNLLQTPDDGNNWLDVSHSLAKAIQFALGWLIVGLAAIIQLPMMLLQYVMECLCYLFLPIAISLFAFDSTKGLAIRYIQQTLAILAWPIGFAVVDLVGFSLLTTTTNAVTGGNAPDGNAPILSPASLLFGGLVAIWLILGSLVTPVIMQALFCSGTPLSSALGHSLQAGMALAGMRRFLGSKGGPSMASSQSSSGSDSSTFAPSSGTSGPHTSSSPPPMGAAGSTRAAGEPAPTPHAPSGAESSDVMHSPRGSLAVGEVADSITPAQAQDMANRSGTPFTQAFSDGTVVTHEPAVSKVPPASTFTPTSTPDPEIT